MLAEESGVDSFTFSKDLPVHWCFRAEEETQHLFLAMGWPVQNEFKILIDVTPFEGVVGIIVRDPLFILGYDEVSLLSVGDTIKQQSASVNGFLRCVLGDNSRPFGALIVKDTTNDFP